MARTNNSARAIIIQDNKILLIHRFKNGVEYYVFPGGGVEESDKDDIEAVIREVYEETGLKVTDCKHAFDAPKKTGGMDKYYLCDVSEGDPHLTGEEKDRNSPENHYEPAWFDLSILEKENVYPDSARLYTHKYLDTEAD